MIAMLTVNGLIGIMAQPHMPATVGTGRDERTCRIGMLFGNMIKRVCTVGWALVGLIVAAMIAQGKGDAALLTDPENAFGFACRHLLFPGALGLMIAAILAANMSTCSAFLVDSGALFTEGLYRRRLVPGRLDVHYLWVGRLSGLAITLLGVLYAVFLIQSVLYTFLLTETMATFVGISILGGLVWGRANRWGALASLVAAFVTNFALYYATGQRLDYWDPNVFVAALAAGIAALVVVSLITAPEPAAALSSFFDRLRRSSDHDDASPGAAADDSPLLLVNLLRLRAGARGRGWRAYREDLNGFVLGWVIVIVLVAITALRQE
jgi:Na+/proline symporter